MPTRVGDAVLVDLHGTWHASVCVDVDERGVWLLDPPSCSLALRRWHRTGTARSTTALAHYFLHDSPAWRPDRRRRCEHKPRSEPEQPQPSTKPPDPPHPARPVVRSKKRVKASRAPEKEEKHHEEEPKEEMGEERQVPVRVEEPRTRRHAWSLVRNTKEPKPSADLTPRARRQIRCGVEAARDVARAFEPPYEPQRDHEEHAPTPLRLVGATDTDTDADAAAPWLKVHDVRCTCVLCAVRPARLLRVVLGAGESVAVFSHVAGTAACVDGPCMLCLDPVREHTVPLADAADTLLLPPSPPPLPRAPEPTVAVSDVAEASVDLSALRLDSHAAVPGWTEEGDGCGDADLSTLRLEPCAPSSVHDAGGEGPAVDLSDWVHLSRVGRSLDRHFRTGGSVVRYGSQRL